jgi:hypothetical protein
MFFLQDLQDILSGLYSRHSRREQAVQRQIIEGDGQVLSGRFPAECAKEDERKKEDYRKSRLRSPTDDVREFFHAKSLHAISRDNNRGSVDGIISYSGEGLVGLVQREHGYLGLEPDVGGDF